MGDAQLPKRRKHHLDEIGATTHEELVVNGGGRCPRADTTLWRLHHSAAGWPIQIGHTAQKPQLHYSAMLHN